MKRILTRTEMNKLKYELSIRGLNAYAKFLPIKNALTVDQLIYMTAELKGKNSKAMAVVDKFLSSVKIKT